ncbi:unnamed protein product [Effrenium voratum]|uniref:Uncharacterized protein n=1 Tax=Effrenium voratum TaxID=2562239 RepID=A0AA36I5Y7_9DINO|nr:unnamed protein product [Effrenium voratum]
MVAEFDYWLRWASQLQAGQKLWYQRCEGRNVLAEVVDVCPEHNACWVKYQVQRPQGGQQHRRALVKLEELARLQQQHEDLSSEQQHESFDSESLSQCDADPQARIEEGRRKAFSMIAAESSDSEGSLRHGSRRSKLYSMLFVSDDERPRAYSMLTDSGEELRRRAISMIFQDEPEHIRRRNVMSMVVEEPSDIPHELHATEDESSLPDREERGSDEPQHWRHGSDDDRSFSEPDKSDAERSTTSPSESESQIVGSYGEDAALWPSALWAEPQLVGLEPGNVGRFCDSAPDSCSHCTMALAGHSTHKVEAEMAELCRVLQQKVASLSGDDDGEVSTETQPLCREFLLTEEEEEEADPEVLLRQHTPHPDAWDLETTPVQCESHSGTALRVEQPKKRNYLVDAWSHLLSQDRARAVLSSWTSRRAGSNQGAKESSRHKESGNESTSACDSPTPADGVVPMVEASPSQASSSTNQPSCCTRLRSPRAVTRPAHADAPSSPCSPNSLGAGSPSE